VERTGDNLAFCEKQIIRLEVCRFFDRLTPIGRQELRDALCDTSDSRAAAEMRITTWLRTETECPTPADFTRMAKMERDEARAQESWKPTREREFTGCRKCGGSGFQIIYTLTTVESRSGSAFTKTEPITKKVWESLNGKLDPKMQRVYSGARKCDCGAVPGTQPIQEPPWSAEERHEADEKFAAFFSNPKNKSLIEGKTAMGSIMRKLAPTPQPTATREPGDDDD
jgi:hypothetical protein